MNPFMYSVEQWLKENTPRFDFNKVAKQLL